MYKEFKMKMKKMKVIVAPGNVRAGPPRKLRPRGQKKWSRPSSIEASRIYLAFKC